MYIVFGNNEVLNVKLVPAQPSTTQKINIRNVAEKKFHINSRYKEHNDVTEEISHGILSYIDVGRFILGNYIEPDEIHQRPLYRMTQAVARQLGII